MILKRNDIILIAALIIAAFGLQLYNSKRDYGSSVEIFVDGKPYGVYSLYENKKINVLNTDNNINVVEISNSQAYVISADCHDKICVKHGGISKSGEAIICIPNRVSIKISGTNVGLDAILQ